MRVHEASSADVEFLSGFGAESFIQAYSSALPGEALNDYVAEKFSESTIHEELNQRSIIYLVCRNEDDSPCGYAKLIESAIPGVIDSSQAIELQRLYVSSEYHGQGAGKLLEFHAVAQVIKQNKTHIWLRVWEGNQLAIQVYKRWGYEIVGDEPYQVGNEQRTVLLMQKPLAMTMA